MGKINNLLENLLFYEKSCSQEKERPVREWDLGKKDELLKENDERHGRDRRDRGERKRSRDISESDRRRRSRSVSPGKKDLFSR